MDPQRTNDEERLLDLLENKEFDQLNPEERAFVEQHLSRTDYLLQRRMIMEVTQLDYGIPEARPLVIPGAGSHSFVRKTVPLYQAITAVAATIALFLSLWPGENTQSQQPGGNRTRLSQTDTVIQTKVIQDTVIRYVRQRETQRNGQTASDHLVQATQLRILEAGAVPLPELTEELVRTRGTSLKDDSATRAILNGMYQTDARSAQ